MSSIYSIPRFRQGPQVSASALNTMLEEIIRLREAVAGKPQGRRKPFAILNDTDDDLDAFSVLGLGDSGFNPDDHGSDFKAAVYIEGEQPDISEHVGNWGIIQEPISADRIGAVMLAGISQVQVNVVQVSHGYAEVKDDDATQLESCASGSAKILWKESGTGTKWAIVRFPTDEPHYHSATNVGDTELEIGCPAVTDRDDNPTGYINETLALQVPNEDACPLVFVVVENDIDPTDSGESSESSSATGRSDVGLVIGTSRGVFRARVDQAVEVGDSVGVLDGETTFMLHSLGFRVVAYLGDLYEDENFWADLECDPIPPALEIQSIAADKVTVQLITEDEVASGVDVVLYYLGA